MLHFFFFARKIGEYDRKATVADLANPINIYLITKRLTKDLNDLSDIITNNNAAESKYKVKYF